MRGAGDPAAPEQGISKSRQEAGVRPREDVQKKVYASYEAPKDPTIPSAHPCMERLLVPLYSRKERGEDNPQRRGP